jgi:hypothetical protein
VSNPTMLAYHLIFNFFLDGKSAADNIRGTLGGVFDENKPELCLTWVRKRAANRERNGHVKA